MKSKLKQSGKSAKKTFVLDTNVILHDSSCIFQFEEHDIVIPIAVVVTHLGPICINGYRIKGVWIQVEGYIEHVGLIVARKTGEPQGVIWRGKCEMQDET